VYGLPLRPLRHAYAIGLAVEVAAWGLGACGVLVAVAFARRALTGRSSMGPAFALRGARRGVLGPQRALAEGIALVPPQLPSPSPPLLPPLLGRIHRTTVRMLVCNP
jgi:hypothetical protein